MTKQEIIAKVAELKELEAMAKELENELEAVKDELKAVMVEAQADEMVAGNYVIRYKDVISQRIDSKTLKKELPSIYEKYSKATTTKRFTVA